MFKKSRFTGSSAALGVALFLIVLLAFSGCPTGTGSSVTEDGPPTGGNNNGGGGGNDIDPPSYNPAAKASELANKINTAGGGGVVEVSGTTVTLLKDIDVYPPVQTSLMKVAVDIHLSSFDIPNGVTFVVAKDLTVTVKENATITVADGGTITLEPQGEGSSGGTVTVEANGTLTAAGTVTVAAAATLTVEEGATLEVTAGTVTVARSGALTANGTVTVAADAALEVLGTLTVAESAEFTTAGTLTVVETGTVAGEGTITVNGGSTSGVPADNIEIGDGVTASAEIPVAAVADLTDAIEKAKGFNGGGVVQLTEAFYTAANTAGVVLVIDANATDNESPYTVRGLGKDGTALAVGVLLANDNVTLEQVKINIDTYTKAVYTEYLSIYRAAVSIARASAPSTLLTEANAPSKNVTVRDCNITYTTSSNMAAGIFVTSYAVGTAVAVPENVTITGNDITVSHTSAVAAAGILIRGYGTTLTVTGNVAEAVNTSGGTNDTPSNELFMQVPVGQDTGTPDISENSFKGTLFDFYVNAFTHDDFVGNAALVADKFGTVDTVWITGQATDTGSFYKTLIPALIGQSQNAADAGFGAFFLYLGASTSSVLGTSFALEYYELTNGAVTAIDYWSAGLADGNTAYKSDGDNVLGNSPSVSNTKGIRARRTVTSDGFTPGNFHWYRGENATDSNNLTGI
jgi:hypothetical protein